MWPTKIAGASILTLNLICPYIHCDKTRLFDWVVCPQKLLASLPQCHKAVLFFTYLLLCFALNLFISSTSFMELKMWYIVGP